MSGRLLLHALRCAERSAFPSLLYRIRIYSPVKALLFVTFLFGRMTQSAVHCHPVRTAREATLHVEPAWLSRGTVSTAGGGMVVPDPLLTV